LFMRALVKRIIIETSLSNSNTPERATIEFGKPVGCLTGRGATKMALLSRLALDPEAWFCMRVAATSVKFIVDVSEGAS
jgi:hypothetical protein